MLKKLSVPFFIQAAGTLLVLAGLIVAIVSNATQGYGIADFGQVILFSILGLVMAGGTLFVVLKWGNEHFIAALTRVAAIIFVSIAFAIVLISRVEVAGTFSWDRGNQTAMNAFITGVVAVGMMLVAVIAYIVAGFLNDKKQAEEAPAVEEKPAEEPAPAAE